MTQRRYEVFATDTAGDVHCFHTDVRARADSVKARMGEGAVRVTLYDYEDDTQKPEPAGAAASHGSNCTRSP